MSTSSTPEFRLPDESKRIAIVGRTGSGKTQFGTWVLSQSSWDKRPFVIVDYKRDDLLNSIEGIQEVSFKDKLGKDGLHIIHPRPDEDDKVEEYLWSLWARENVGLFVDEGYMVPDKGALRAILTQGRSKKIPAIILSQRPVYLTRFVFTEADFFAAFHLNHQDDERAIRKYFGGKKLDDLPEYWSRYYDVSKDALWHLKPVPDRDRLLETFSNRMRQGNQRRVRFV